MAPPIILAPEERRQLDQWSRGRSTPHRLVSRSQIVLCAADGKTNKEIVEELGINSITVGKWRSRFALLRIEGIRQDAPRPGAPSIGASLEKKIVDTTLRVTPPGESHWSTRTLGDHLGVSHMTVHRVWKARRLQPFRTQSFELSPDPKFEEKLFDVVGLYVNPPENALVFSVDEKPQMQALERTQTILPVRKNFPEGRPHEYKRNGTIDLYAALEILTGDVTVEFHHRHRHQEFLAFLSTLDRQADPEFEVHVIVDNLSAHLTEEVQRWMHRHPRFHLHLTPTHASWLNAVEGWFSKLTTRRVRRGSFSSVRALQQAVEEYVEVHNRSAMPLVWTKSADEILRKVRKIQRLSVTGH
ncbi:MAG TPA: IS630 family transposase [Thermoplasmata archaeon]|nr:IS630 family transposase [Thermoplasmata archaeon]